MYLSYSSEAKHDLTGVKVAIKIINKRKMKNKNLISKVYPTRFRSNDRSRYSNSSATKISSNFIKYSIPPTTSSSSWNWQTAENFTITYKITISPKNRPDFSSGKSSVVSGTRISTSSHTAISNQKIYL